MRFGYFVLAVVGIFWALAFVWIVQRPGPAFDPLKAFAPCRIVVDGPTQLFVCANGHAYTHVAGRFVDAGLVSPRPQVPAA